MAQIRYGSTPEEWDAFIALAPKDIRPVVSDPNIPKLPQSIIDDPAKVPTVVGQGFSEGKYHGILNWVKKVYSPEELAYWRSEPAHGTCIVCNKLKAIDIDIDSPSEAVKVQALVEAHLGFTAVRRRKNSGRCVLLYRVLDNDGGECPFMRKQVVKTPNGAVEFLGNNQQVMVAGTHKSGERYYWDGGLPTPDDIAEVSVEDIISTLIAINEHYGTDKNLIFSNDGASSVEVSSRNIKQIADGDHEFNFVINSPYFREFLPDGKVAVKCPLEHLHASTNGEFDGNLSATVYLPKGLGGLQQSGFKCMHASHGEITIQKFLNEIGYVPEEFEITEDDKPEVASFQEPPRFMGVNRKTGEIPATTINVCSALENAKWFGIDLRYDEFANRIEICHLLRKPKTWSPFTDNDYVEITKRLQMPFNFKQPSKEVLRGAVANVAFQNKVDIARDWLTKLEWDGFHRIDTFATDVWGTINDEYNHAVARYMWTAMAGRILKPGVKADMIPVLVGNQGVRKSTFVGALVPQDSGWAGEINIAVNDDNNARLVQGKSVIELPELKGLTSKAEETIKAWVTRTSDSWIPKFMEQAITLPRRFIMVGSTNQVRFLSDSTGNRRWLPVTVCKTKEWIDTDYLIKNIGQLWAEAKFLFEKNGVMWQKAEALGKEVTKRHTSEDSWKGLIRRWFDNQDFDAMNSWDEYTVDQILVLALAKAPASITRGDTARVERILSELGWMKDEEAGKWFSLL